MKDGLDDFRDGLPPPVEGGIVLQVCLYVNRCSRSPKATRIPIITISKQYLVIDYEVIIPKLCPLYTDHAGPEISLHLYIASPFSR